MGRTQTKRPIVDRPIRLARSATAFSLVEMLIVVSVILLLASILLPSLKSAREQAKKAVCASHTSAIGRGAFAYSALSSGWLCGSPGTSGSVLFSPDRPDPAETNIDAAPVQIWDYAGPIAATSMKMSLSPDRVKRFGVVIEGVFSCPSNRYEADPFPSGAGTFPRQKMVSYNTFRNFLMWPRTIADRNPANRWGPHAPVPEASFDRIGGDTLQPRSHLPNIDRIVNPAAKAYLADGNRFTDQSGRVTYDIEWDALDGGAFCNGGPTLREFDAFQFVLSSYHYDKRLGSFGYRHGGAGERGIVVHHFDGHSRFLTETQSRSPDRWWPKGTVIPFQEFNDPARKHLIGRMDRHFTYRVGR